MTLIALPMSTDVDIPCTPSRPVLTSVQTVTAEPPTWQPVDSALDAVDVVARLIGEEVGRLTPAQPVEIVLTTLAVRLRDEVYRTARMAGHTDGGADLLRLLDDTLNRMAPAMENGSLDNRENRNYR